ncbi:MAG: hypothetical protein L0K12_08890, partial [Brevibacterium aurantiacum]|nr:hypothetical protein [Brevibacterium aurantiacum]
TERRACPRMSLITDLDCVFGVFVGHDSGDQLFHVDDSSLERDSAVDVVDARLFARLLLRRTSAD